LSVSPMYIAVLLFFPSSFFELASRWLRSLVF
jgi:hypothetical protein